jgi:hypothetical protein
VQELEGGGFGDLLSRSQVHAGVRDGVDDDGGAAARERQNPNSFRYVLEITLRSVI